MLKLKEQEFKKLIKFNSNKVNVVLHSKNDTGLYSHLARGLHEPSGWRLQVSLKVACLMVKPHWVQDDLSASSNSWTLEHFFWPS